MMNPERNLDKNVTSPAESSKPKETGKERGERMINAQEHAAKYRVPRYVELVGTPEEIARKREEIARKIVNDFAQQFESVKDCARKNGISLGEAAQLIDQQNNSEDSRTKEHEEARKQRELLFGPGPIQTDTVNYMMHNDSGESSSKQIDELKQFGQDLKSSDTYKNYEEIAIEIGKKWAESDNIYKEHSSDFSIRYEIDLKKFSQRSLQDQEAMLNELLEKKGLSQEDHAILQNYSQLNAATENLENSLATSEFNNLTDKIEKYNRQVKALRITTLENIPIDDNIANEALNKERQRLEDQQYYPYKEWLQAKEQSGDNVNKELELREQVETTLKTLLQELEGSATYQVYKRLAEDSATKSALASLMFQEYANDFYENYNNITTMESFATLSVSERQNLGESPMQSTTGQNETLESSMGEDWNRLVRYAELIDDRRSMEVQLDNPLFDTMKQRLRELNDKIGEFKNFNPESSVQALPHKGDLHEEAYQRTLSKNPHIVTRGRAGQLRLYEQE